MVIVNTVINGLGFFGSITGYMIPGGGDQVTAANLLTDGDVRSPDAITVPLEDTRAAVGGFVDQSAR